MTGQLPVDFDLPSENVLTAIEMQRSRREVAKHDDTKRDTMVSGRLITAN